MADPMSVDDTAMLVQKYILVVLFLCLLAGRLRNVRSDEKFGICAHSKMNTISVHGCSLQGSLGRIVYMGLPAWRLFGARRRENQPQLNPATPKIRATMNAEGNIEISK